MRDTQKHSDTTQPQSVNTHSEVNYWYDDCDDEPTVCDYCLGDGQVIDCCDDICHGQGYCIHGENTICPVCHGEGEIYRGA